MKKKLINYKNTIAIIENLFILFIHSFHFGISLHMRSLLKEHYICTVSGKLLSTWMTSAYTHSVRRILYFNAVLTNVQNSWNYKPSTALFYAGLFPYKDNFKCWNYSSPYSQIANSEFK